MASVNSLSTQVCQACGGTGWTRVSREGVQGVVRCECININRLERLLDAGKIARRTTHDEFENFHVLLSRISTLLLPPRHRLLPLLPLE